VALYNCSQSTVLSTVVSFARLHRELPVPASSNLGESVATLHRLVSNLEDIVSCTARYACRNSSSLVCTTPRAWFGLVHVIKVTEVS